MTKINCIQWLTDQNSLIPNGYESFKEWIENPDAWCFLSEVINPSNNNHIEYVPKGHMDPKETYFMIFCSTDWMNNIDAVPYLDAALNKNLSDADNIHLVFWEPDHVFDPNDPNQNIRRRTVEYIFRRIQSKAERKHLVRAGNGSSTIEHTTFMEHSYDGKTDVVEYLRKIPQKISLQPEIAFTKEQGEELKQRRLFGDSSFCMTPFTSFYFEPKGRVTSCCMANYTYSMGNPKEKSLTDIWNGPSAQELREYQLAGKEHPSCSVCMLNERKGLINHRERFNTSQAHLYDDIFDEYGKPRTETFPIKFLDLRFNNLCNYACRSCSPLYSTKWYKDASAVGMTPLTGVIDGGFKVADLAEDLKYVEAINFAGGEPTMQDQFYETLDYLLEVGNTDLHVYMTTNMSLKEHKGRNPWELLSNFHVCMVASLDAEGKRAELIRYGTKWSETLAAWENMREHLQGSWKQVAATTGVQNAWHLPDFFENWIERGLVDDPDRVSINPIHEPIHLNAKILPPEFKQEITEKFYKLINKYPGYDRMAKDLYGFIDYMNSEQLPEKHIKEFLNFTKALDKTRNENTFETLPELAFLQAWEDK